MEDDEVVHFNKRSLLLLAVFFFELFVCLEFFDFLALDFLDLENRLRKIKLESNKHFDDLDIGHSKNQVLFLHDL